MLQFNSSKLPHYFFSLLNIEWNIFDFNEIKVTISFSFLLCQVEREIPRQNTLHLLVEDLWKK